MRRALFLAIPSGGILNGGVVLRDLHASWLELDASGVLDFYIWLGERHIH